MSLSQRWYSYTSIEKRSKPNTILITEKYNNNNNIMYAYIIVNSRIATSQNENITYKQYSTWPNIMVNTLDVYTCTLAWSACDVSFESLAIYLAWTRFTSALTKSCAE